MGSILIASVVTYIYINTSIPYAQNKPELVRIYHHFPAEKQYKVESLKISIIEPFKDTIAEFTISVENHTFKDFGLWEKIHENGSVSQYQFNETKAKLCKKQTCQK